MTLLEFVTRFDDEDPWAVPPHVWEQRFNLAGGLPEGWYLLVDPDLRTSARESLDRDPVREDLHEIDRRLADRYATQRTGDHDEEIGDPPVQTKPRPFALAVARTVRKKRSTARVGLRTVARIAEMTPSTLSRIENGRRGVTIDELERICDVIRVPVSSLLEEARAQQDRPG